ncbi:hypothetical protein OG559_22795 [Micromonospora sp. NBC_01405]|uniref:hypothetical protein n=1 Tax=Micromonospora sp. NBC_01405 TaxID=2903589 RepID=UPI00324E5E74
MTLTDVYATKQVIIDDPSCSCVNSIGFGNVLDGCVFMSSANVPVQPSALDAAGATRADATERRITGLYIKAVEQFSYDRARPGQSLLLLKYLDTVVRRRFVRTSAR